MTATLPRPAEASSETLRGTRRPMRETVFRLALQASLLIAVSFLFALLGYVVYTAWPRLDMDLLRNMPSTCGRRPPVRSRRSPGRSG